MDSSTAAVEAAVKAAVVVQRQLILHVSLFAPETA